MSTTQVDFSIAIKIDAGDSSSIGNSTAVPESEELDLSPAQPHKVSKNKAVEAELLGDLAGYTELPTMRYLSGCKSSSKSCSRE